MLLYDINNILYLICLSAVFKVGWPSVSELFKKKQHNMIVFFYFSVFVPGLNKQ